MVLPSYRLSLADGERLVIRAGNENLVGVVNTLGLAMELPYCGDSGRQVVVVDGPLSLPPIISDAHRSIVCFLKAPECRDLLLASVMELSVAIAKDTQRRGGVLLHGAVAVRPGTGRAGSGCGVILAGPGTVGKTTASRRLPPPWRSLSDDATLVVRHPQGRYWAHPWPTWSQFFNDGPGGTWPVEKAVPLRAVFFLSQCPVDSVVSLMPAQTTALLMESVQQVSRFMSRGLSHAEKMALHEEQLTAAAALAEAIPAYRLNISLNGEFWKEMEKVLSALPARPFPDHAVDPGSRTPASKPRASFRRKPESGFQGPFRAPVFAGGTERGSQACLKPAVPSADRPLSPSPSPAEARVSEDSPIPVVYTGPSMNPTLREPDLLEVVPYGGKAVRVGDVIHYHPPGGGRAVVHRVVRVTPGGLRTRGDNNREEDPYVVPLSAVMGRVVAAERGGRRRTVAGGPMGRIQRHAARLEQAVLRTAERLLHRTYHGLARTGLFRYVLPPRLNPRLVAFETRAGRRLKVMMGQHAVAHYDVRDKKWRIRRPFRLFVDEASLPRPDVGPPAVPPGPALPRQS